MVNIRTFTLQYADLEKLTGLTYANVRQHISRGLVDPENLESIVIWLAKWGRPELRQAVAANALFVPDNRARTKPKVKKTKKAE